MTPYDNHEVGFSGERVGTKGYIELYTTFGKDKACKILNIRYLVIDVNTSYNILLGQSSLNKLGAIVSTPHLAMKFPSPSRDILSVHVDQKVAKECYVESLRLEPTRRETRGSRSPRRKTPRRQRSPWRETRPAEHAVALVNLNPRVM